MKLIEMLAVSRFKFLSSNTQDFIEVTREYKQIYTVSVIPEL